MALFPLGILSAAGAGGPSFSSDYELIATSFGTGSSSTITFSSIPQSFRYLQVRWTARSTGNTFDLQTRFNGVTSGSYSRRQIFGNGSAVSASGSPQTSQTRITVPWGVADSAAGAGITSAGVMDIFDYSSTSKNTTIRSLHGGTSLGGADRIVLSSGGFYNTSAITSIDFFLDAGNFSSISRFSLYGIRG